MSRDRAHSHQPVTPDRATNEELLPELTGIPGFDTLTRGGLAPGRITLVAGTTGSGKSVFGVQFLMAGIAAGAPGVLVSCGEPAGEIRRNMRSFGWDLAAHEAAGRLAIVDASVGATGVEIIGEALTGPFDLAGLSARIETAVGRVGARRVVVDTLDALFTGLGETRALRRELSRLAAVLRAMGVTALLTAERNVEYGDLTDTAVEEFVADNVVILRNLLEDRRRRRTIEVLKLRGHPHHTGEYPLTIVPGAGLVIFPLSAYELDHPASSRRLTTGSDELDTMTGGGFFDGSVVLVSGATGTGKTLAAATFLAGGAERGERCLLFGFEESRDQILRNAAGWGHDFEALERDGLLVVDCAYPESANIEDHFLRMRSEIERFAPQRIVIDSLAALERIATAGGYAEFLLSLTSYVRKHQIATLVTASSPVIVGDTSITEAHISNVTDAIVLLRYVETHGELRRGMIVLKMRGSAHDRRIREFTIDHLGLHVGGPFTALTGILSGHLDFRPADGHVAVASPGPQSGGAPDGS